jgi:hypothetical protein
MGTRKPLLACSSQSVPRNTLTTSTHFQKAPIDLNEWISQAEAARLRNVSRQAIAKLVGNGRLRTLELGGRSFVSRADVLGFEPNPPGRPKGAAHE